MATSTSVGHTSQEYVDKIAQLKNEVHAVRQVKDVARQQLEEVRQREDVVRKQLVAARQQVVPLAFTALLALCHHEIAEIQVESDPAKCTTSTVGKIGNQLLPHSLREWIEFADLQRSIFTQVSDIYDKCP